ncbi:MAG: hypothetical protein HY735_21630 [Verrucomicrobia bacterium]|nr:hypothetical protein [Verrucomicrobiota bacterium]
MAAKRHNPSQLGLGFSGHVETMDIECRGLFSSIYLRKLLPSQNETNSPTEAFRFASTVLEAKRVDHPLDEVSKKETSGWFPSQQVQDYLHHAKDASGTRFFDWAILTNGHEWRLYCDRAAADAFFSIENRSDGVISRIETKRVSGNGHSSNLGKGGHGTG